LRPAHPDSAGAFRKKTLFFFDLNTTLMAHCQGFSMHWIRCPRYSTWNNTSRLTLSLNGDPDFSTADATIFPPFPKPSGERKSAPVR
jgi:hypothetical protein